MFLWLSMNFFISSDKRMSDNKNFLMRLQVMGSLLVVNMFESLNNRKNAN